MKQASRNKLVEMEKIASLITEKEFQSQVLELAAYCHWKAYHTFDSRRSAEGFPDNVLVRPPRVVFCEVKSSQGKLSPYQIVWKILLEKCPGVEYHLWYPIDWDEIVKVLSL